MSSKAKKAAPKIKCPHCGHTFTRGAGPDKVNRPNQVALALFVLTIALLALYTFKTVF